MSTPDQDRLDALTEAIVERHLEADTPPNPKGFRLETFQTSPEWLDALVNRVTQKYSKQTYWIKCIDEREVPPLNTLLNGWIAVYARPGANEADVVCMDWIKEATNRRESNTILRLLTIKTESGLDHALEIAAWITRANYSFKETT